MLEQSGVAGLVSVCRQARGLVTVNGVRVPFVQWGVENTTHFQADTFRVTLACAALPAEMSAQVLLTADVLTVEVFAGFPANAEQFSAQELVSLLLGRVDTLVYDAVANTLELSGRDYTGVFIDAKTTEKWGNKRVSDIVSALAARHGLTAQVGTTQGFAGNAYQIDQVRLAMQRSEWDVLTWLATETGYTVFVRGLVLYFVPPVDGSTPPGYFIDWQAAGVNGVARAPVVSLSLSRNMSIAKGVSVTVSSHHFRTNTPYSATVAPTVAKGAATGPGAGVQAYSYVIPGLNPAQARQRAQTIYAQLVAHELTVSVSLPGDNVLSTSTPVLISGLNHAADQVYFPDSISRSMSLEEGYTMSFTAKNMSPQTAAAEAGVV